MVSLNLETLEAFGGVWIPTQAIKVMEQSSYLRKYFYHVLSIFKTCLNSLIVGLHSILICTSE